RPAQDAEDAALVVELGRVRAAEEAVHAEPLAGDEDALVGEPGALPEPQVADDAVLLRRLEHVDPAGLAGDRAGEVLAVAAVERRVDAVQGQHGIDAAARPEEAPAGERADAGEAAARGELELRRPRDRELAAEGDHRLVRDRQAAVPGERRALPDRARGDLETQLSAVQVDLAAGVERDAGEDDGVRTGRDERLRDRERPAVVHAGRVDAALEAGEPRSDDGRQLARRTVVEADVAADLDQRRADRQAAVVRDQRAERVVGRA